LLTLSDVPVLCRKRLILPSAGEKHSWNFKKIEKWNDRSVCEVGRIEGFELFEALPGVPAMRADHQEARWRQDLKSGSSRREMVGAHAVLHVAPQSMLVRSECLTQRAEFHPNSRIDVRIMKDSIGSRPRMPLPNGN
jgi:hypothetical protein